jgi:hypothetical protein
MRAGLLYFDAPVANADGTTTQGITSDGQNVKTQALHGPVVEQGAGRIQVT